MELTSMIQSHPDNVAIERYLNAEGTRISTIHSGPWWQGLSAFADSFDGANEDTLLWLKHIPGIFFCHTCKKWTNIPDKSKVWFLKMGFGLWKNEESVFTADHVELETNFPLTFCQNYGCRSMVFLYETKVGLRAIDNEDPGLGDFVKKLIVSRLEDKFKLPNK